MIIEKELNSIVNNFNFFTAIEVANVLNKIGKEIITADKVSSGLKRYLNDKHLHLLFLLVQRKVLVF